MRDAAAILLGVAMNEALRMTCSLEFSTSSIL